MSTYWTVLDTVRSTLAELTAFAPLVEDGPPAIPIKIRKRPFFSIDHGDSYPLCCLSGPKEEIAELQMNKGAWIDYPVYVVLFQQFGATLQSETQLQWQYARREEVFDALFMTGLAGFDIAYHPDPAFDLGGLDQLHDVSVQQFTYRVSKSRG